ncbi:hypothetical protein [Hymenobacter crusticola]|uniref:hypothetical protein n=1 Tax=Hymenobacter crusticola TaxID=1770526 RepID=UPI00117A46A2|nr:hypothetical protein [Hymenobacter crusticola]
MVAVKRKIGVLVWCGFLLSSLLSCKKEENGPTTPYYQFTDDDKLWLNSKQGDKWVFETETGKRQSYLIDTIQKKIKYENRDGNLGFHWGSSVKFYSDEVKIEFTRLDSLGFYSLEFRRTLPKGADYYNPPSGNGEFAFGGLWRTYNGRFNFQQIAGNVNVAPSQLKLSSPITLTIRGKVYNRVIIISPDQLDNLFVEKTYINTMYYDQQNGVVRMVSTTGEVWDRLP